jgi:hypothetical protein
MTLIEEIDADGLLFHMYSDGTWTVSDERDPLGGYDVTSQMVDGLRNFLKRLEETGGAREKVAAR